MLKATPRACTNTGSYIIHVMCRLFGNLHPFRI